MISNDFAEVMQNKTDEQLIEIVTKRRNDYQPDAVEAADIEIQRRGIDPVNLNRDISSESNTEDRYAVEVKRCLSDSGIRFIQYIIDTLTIFVLCAIFTGIIDAFGGDSGKSMFLMVCLIYLLYFSLMEHNLQATVGMLATSSKIIDLQTEKAPDLKAIIIRTIVSFIPIELIINLFIPYPLRDTLSGTVIVVEKKRLIEKS